MAKARLAVERVGVGIVLDIVGADQPGIGLRAVAIGRAIIVAAAAAGCPVVILRRILDRRKAERHTDGVVGKLVDIDGRNLVTLVRTFGVQRLVLAQRTLDVDAEGFLGFQRVIGLQVDRAGQAGVEQVGRRRLDDVDFLEQVTRILAIVKATVVVDRGDHAAIERGGGVIRAEAADRQVLGAARSLLHGQAGQACQRVGDRHVGQLAHVFGRNRFNHRNRQFLDAVGVGDRTGIAADHDLAGFGFGRLGGRRGRVLRHRGRKPGNGHGCNTRLQNLLEQRRRAVARIPLGHVSLPASALGASCELLKTRPCCCIPPGMVPPPRHRCSALRPRGPPGKDIDIRMLRPCTRMRVSAPVFPNDPFENRCGPASYCTQKKNAR